jgi:hypothetical protein
MSALSSSLEGYYERLRRWGHFLRIPPARKAAKVDARKLTGGYRRQVKRVRKRRRSR